MRFVRRHAATIILVAAFLIGIALIAYPSFSNWWNQFHQTRAIATYNDAVDSIDKVDYEAMLADAHAYNEGLVEFGGYGFELTKEQEDEYDSMLDITGDGIMAYIEIPKIRCELPIYHGTEENVLQVAVGHLPGSSLPVGGESTHCVISSHRGLPRAKLFTDLDQLQEGDIFVLRTLNETMTYEVDQIRIVLPNDLSALKIEEGQDLCTLVTCTPYGINTHRLLVRGHRIENTPDVLVNPDAIQIRPAVVAPVLALPLLLVLLVWLLVSTRKSRRTAAKEEVKNRLMGKTDK